MSRMYHQLEIVATISPLFFQKSSVDLEGIRSSESIRMGLAMRTASIIAKKYIRSRNDKFVEVMVCLKKWASSSTNGWTFMMNIN